MLCLTLVLEYELQFLRICFQKSFRDSDYEDSLNILRKALSVKPSCSNLKFLAMRCLVILKRSPEVDDEINSSNTLDVLEKYYEGKIADSFCLMNNKIFAEPISEITKFKNSISLLHNHISRG